MTKAIIAIIIALSIGAANTASSISASSAVYKVKAAFIYNFTKFIEGPIESFQAPNDPINVCVLGKDPFGRAIDAIENKTSKGRGFKVRRIRILKENSELQSCHVLFINKSYKRNLSKILKTLGDSSVLTISDMNGFTVSGGIIGFETKESKVGFSINVEAAIMARLTISSRLLSLARIVNHIGSGKD